MVRLLRFVIPCLLLPALAQAAVRLPHVISEHMVLQQERPLPIWGWANPGEKVSVQLGEAKAKSTTANNEGEWRVDLDPTKAGGPFPFTVTGANTIAFQDVYVGEVWLCSGQSNMQWPVTQSANPQEEIANAKWPLIRHFAVPRRPSPHPLDDVDATWQLCDPGTVGNFTAVGYFFGRTLHQDLDVPIGLLNASWGGTRIEPWTPPEGFASVPAVKDIHDEVMSKDPASPTYQEKMGAFLDQVDTWSNTTRNGLRTGNPVQAIPQLPEAIKPYTSHQSPCMLYNGMLHGLVPYAIRGSIWYQGESNHAEGMLYYEKTKALVNGWRSRWGYDLPYYFVQIAPFKYGAENATILPRFWEAQTEALKIPKTGMVVIHDIGNLNNIHPKNKQEVGRRLALIALAKDYGRKDLVYSGPMFDQFEVKEDTMTISFKHVGAGLKTRDGKAPNRFELAGAGTGWHKAETSLTNNTVVLMSEQVPNPTAVRFAWDKLAEPNLMNEEGLPAAPFRAGEVPKVDLLKTKVKEADGFKLVYDLDLNKLGPTIEYDADHAAKMTKPFGRVAYFLETGKDAEVPTEYLFVSMDAFTKDARQLGIPFYGSGIRHQMKVSNLSVVSNVPGVKNGAVAEGNLEFWPHNYGPINDAKVPNASNDLFDFGDAPVEPENGYGSMQVHNLVDGQVLFAVNQWKRGQQADIGIGNSSGKTRDWTFTSSGKNLGSKRLRVLVSAN